MPGNCEDVVSTIIARWTAAFSRLDAVALSSLYASNAFFFGSNPTLYRGREGVASYFRGLPRWRTPGVAFTEVAVSQVAPDVINMAAIADFDLGEEADPLSVKITWVIVRADGDWTIASHHVSSRAALIAPKD